MPSSYKNITCKGTVASIEDAFNVLEELGNEIRDVVEAAEGGFAATQRIVTLGETADALELLSTPDVPEHLRELPIEYVERTMMRKGRQPGREVRCDNALNVLRAAGEAIEKWLTEGDDTGNRMEAEELSSLLEDAIFTGEGCEFPGMFG